MTFNRSVFLEALIGSAGILLAGFITIPLAAWLVGAEVSARQGVLMGWLFFIGRFVFLALVRATFERHRK